jgi:hypothetical protein
VPDPFKRIRILDLIQRSKSTLNRKHLKVIQ